jgi:hypothetical protein
MKRPAERIFRLPMGCRKSPPVLVNSIKKIMLALGGIIEGC